MDRGTPAPDYSVIIPNYDPLLQQLARQIKGRSPMVSGLETDDLVQEGYIAIWLCIEAGKTPSKLVLYRRMLNWVRYLRNSNKIMTWENENE